MKKSYAPIRIVLADDHEIFRDGFNGILKKQDDIKLVGEASNGEELIAVAQRCQPDVILTDIRMPVMDGISATRILSEKLPQANVIALSMFNDDNLVLDMMEAGAKGYLLKNAHKTEILEAIKAVYNQEIYYCRHTSDKLIKMMAQSRAFPGRKSLRLEFSEKELTVIKLICEQHSNKEIAEMMHSSIRTVEGYRLKIQEKMKVRNSAGIVVFAIKHKLYNI